MLTASSSAHLARERSAHSRFQGQLQTPGARPITSSLKCITPTKAPGCGRPTPADAVSLYKYASACVCARTHELHESNVVYGFIRYTLRIKQALSMAFVQLIIVVDHRWFQSRSFARRKSYHCMPTHTVAYRTRGTWGNSRTALTSDTHSTSITHLQNSPKSQSPRPHGTIVRRQAWPHAWVLHTDPTRPLPHVYLQARSSTGSRLAATYKTSSRPMPARVLLAAAWSAPRTREHARASQILSDGDSAHWRLCGGYKIVYQ